jgi:hypothetical protein
MKKWKKKGLATWKEQVDKGFKCMKEPNRDYEQNQEPNYT